MSAMAAAPVPLSKAQKCKLRKLKQRERAAEQEVGSKEDEAVSALCKSLSQCDVLDAPDRSEKPLCEMPKPILTQAGHLGKVNKGLVGTPNLECEVTRKSEEVVGATPSQGGVHDRSEKSHCEMPERAHTRRSVSWYDLEGNKFYVREYGCEACGRTLCDHSSSEEEEEEEQDQHADTKQQSIGAPSTVSFVGF